MGAAVRGVTRVLVVAVLPLTLTLALWAVPAEAGSFFFRVGAAYEESGDATLLDVDCTSTSPPALFGCVTDADGRELAARGDFGSSPAWEVAVGIAAGERTRVDLSYLRRSSLDLDAEANFLGVDGEQPVSSEGRSQAALLGVAVDLGDAAWRVRPFVALGAGAAWNETGEITFLFPGISPDAVTVVRGGRRSDFAWSAAVGASFRWTDSTAIELSLRHTDLGELRTDAGEAAIVRPSGTFRLDIAGIRTDLSATGLVVSVRHRIGAAR